jgi:hypothetical protein
MMFPELQNLDRFGKMIVSALVMAGGAVVMLLYGEGRFSDENVRLFLMDVSEHYMKVLRPPTHIIRLCWRDSAHEACWCPPWSGHVCSHACSSFVAAVSAAHSERVGGMLSDSTTVLWRVECVGGAQ